jgi:hypothetical protein
MRLLAGAENPKLDGWREHYKINKKRRLVKAS